MGPFRGVPARVDSEKRSRRTLRHYCFRLPVTNLAHSTGGAPIRDVSLDEEHAFHSEVEHIMPSCQFCRIEVWFLVAAAAC